MKTTGAVQQGFALLELLVVMALVVVLFVVAIENLLPLRGSAEHAAHIKTVNGLQSAIGLQATQQALRRGADGLAGIDGANPMDWLASPPAGYIGVIGPGDYETVPRGGWGFDAANGVLFYRFRYPEYVEGDFLAPPGVRYRVALERNPDGAAKKIGLRRVDWFEWRTDVSEIKRQLERIRS
jgi:prepilin-type N-terminal cleavage/methylation domain-containing protein